MKLLLAILVFLCMGVVAYAGDCPPEGPVDCGDGWCCRSGELCCGGGKCCPGNKPWACPSKGKCYESHETATLDCDGILMRCK